MSNLKYRLLLIAALVVASVWTLIPRTVVERRMRGGVMQEDTLRRVPLKYGLDLRGGMQLALEIDDSKGTVPNPSEALDRAIRVVRNRIDEFGVAEPVVQKSGNDRIVVELPGIDDQQRAIDVVAKAAFLEFQITDETGALERTIPRLDQILRQKGLDKAPAAAAGAPGAATPGVGGLFGGDSTKSTTVVPGTGADSARADSAAAANDRTGPFARAVQQGQIPGQYLVPRSAAADLERYLALPDVRGALPPGKEVLWGTDSLSLGNEWYKSLYVVDANPIITGEYLIDAKPAQDPVDGNLVQFTLNNEGGRRFRQQTARHIKDNMAIVLDGRVVTAPVLQSAIGARGQITLGGGDLQEAQDLALVLRAGALPTPLRVAEVRTIGPSLGADSVRRGMSAGLLGLAFVIIIMVAYYRFSGVLAIGGLVFYALTTLAFLAAFDAVLTLPGIAGFILSIGMAVDANFLQFERIREELARGKTVRTAIDQGFQNSFAAIIDTHLTTVITAAVLYQFGTGAVQGFAVTLMAGVLSSLVSSVFVVRTLFLLWLNRSRGAQTLSI
jgi:preprotein translocase subunit SecD